MQVGANYVDGDRCEFRVWAPYPDEVALKIHAPEASVHSMEKDERGYWHVTLDGVIPETRYSFLLNGDKERPDPASHFQPDGVHEASAVIDHDDFPWTDNDWQNIPLKEMVLYEIHVGAFTPEGTFEAVIPRLDDLKDLGVNVIELMPVAQFPGSRNWGYDGVYPYAVQNSYGGPGQLKQLVNACHEKRIAVVLDVVYNHLGPEGNYLWDYGPYFTSKYQTPWGEAVNFDDAHSDEVRNYFIENAFHWFAHYHLDGLRLDAVHAIYDMSARPFLQELAEQVKDFSATTGKKVYLMPESDLNDTRIIRPRHLGGFGLDSQWSDDFHHSVHTLLTGEDDGYYKDFGRIEDLAAALRNGFVYDWRYSRHRKRHHGSWSGDRPAEQFIVCTQNHDQVGNRMNGERLSALISLEAQKLAAGILLLSPNIPLLFMGQEYGEPNPFLYFVSHSDEDLIDAVREGRKAEFESFQWEGEPPDPQAENTFRRSELRWALRQEKPHQILYAFYKKLLELRRSLPALNHLEKDQMKVSVLADHAGLTLHRWHEDSAVLVFCNFEQQDVATEISFPPGRWEKLLDSAASIWKGNGEQTPQLVDASCELTIPECSFSLYQKESTV